MVPVDWPEPEGMQAVCYLPFLCRRDSCREKEDSPPPLPLSPFVGSQISGGIPGLLAAGHLAALKARGYSGPERSPLFVSKGQI